MLLFIYNFMGYLFIKHILKIEIHHKQIYFLFYVFIFKIY